MLDSEDDKSIIADLSEKEKEDLKDKTLQIHQPRESDVFKDIIRLHEIVIKNLGLNAYDIVELNLNGIKKCSWLRTIELKDKKRFIKFQQRKLNIWDKIGFKEEIKETSTSGKPSIINPKFWILMDDKTRDYFEVKLYEKHNFQIKNAKFWSKINFYGSHSDPAIRYSFWLALMMGWLSITISIIAVILSLF